MRASANGVGLGIAALILYLPFDAGGRTPRAHAVLQVALLALALLRTLRSPLAPRDPAFPSRPLLALGAILLASGAGALPLDAAVGELLTVGALGLAFVLAFHEARRTGTEPWGWLILGGGVLVSLHALIIALTARPGWVTASQLVGPFGYKNALAGFLLLALFPGLGLVSTARGPLPYGAAAGGTGIVLATLILTKSRAAWLAGLAGLALWAILAARPGGARLRRLVPALALAGLLLPLLPQARAVLPHTGSIGAALSPAAAESSVQWRWSIYRWGMEIAMDHPLLGTGPGTFGTVLPVYQNQAYAYGAYAHNHYIQTLAEAGLPGLLAFLALLVAVGIRGLRGILRQPSPATPIRAGLLSALVASGLHAVVDYDWSLPAIALLFWVEAGVLLGPLPAPAPPVPPGSAPRPTGLSASGGHPAALASGQPLGPRWVPRGGSRGRILCLLLVLSLIGLAVTRYEAGERFEGDRILLRRGDAAARELGARAAALNPFAARYHVAQAEWLLGEGRATEAVPLLRQAIALDPFDAQAHLELGRAAAALGEVSLAEESLKRAVAVGGRRYLATHLDLVRFYLASGREADALRSAQAATALFPPELVEAYRGFSPGNRYLLADIYRIMAGLQERRGNEEAAAEARRLSAHLAIPLTTPVNFGGLREGYTSPEAAVISYWRARSEGDRAAAREAFATTIRSKVPVEWLGPLPPDLREARVTRIFDLVLDRAEAQITYELTLVPRGGPEKREVQSAMVIIEAEGWHLLPGRGPVPP